MNEQLIEDIKNQIRELMQLLIERGEPISDEMRLQLARAMEHASNRIVQLRQEVPTQTPPLPPEQPPIPPEPPSELPPQEPELGAPPHGEIQLLWILAGQNEQAFLQYLTTYPSQITEALLRNPAELQRNIEFLQQMMPEGPNPLQADGIPHANLNSSNIYGFRYNPKNQKLKVRFQGGSVYEYDSVPGNVVNAFQNGSASARTNGQNQYGRWWEGKNPSLGAAFWNYIRNAGYDYRRLR